MELADSKREGISLIKLNKLYHIARQNYKYLTRGVTGLGLAGREDMRAGERK